MDDLEDHDESFAMVLLLYDGKYLNIVYREAGMVN